MSFVHGILPIFGRDELVTMITRYIDKGFTLVNEFNGYRYSTINLFIGNEISEHAVYLFLL